MKSPKSCLRFWLALVFAALCLISPAGAAKPSTSDSEYLNHLAEALELLKAGECQSASEAISAALEHRRDERLAYLVRAVALLQDGSWAEAGRSFEEAGRMGAEADIVAYGQALCRLGQGGFAAADGALPRPGKVVTAAELRLIRAYIALMRGTAADISGIGSEDPRVTLLSAYSRLKSGDSAGAVSLLRTMPWEPLTGSALDRGVTMSFDPSAPLKGAVLRTMSSIAPGTAPSAAGYTGRVRLRADLRKTPGAAYVLFYVDTSLAGIVNTPPFELVWDSSTVANGVHTVRIRGENSAGVLVGETSQQVLVANAAPEPGPPLAGGAADAVVAAAWDALRIRGSRTWAEYQIARHAETAGRRSEAMLGYERILAFQPGYRDVQQRFRALSGWSSSPAVWKGRGTDAAVALTFDDGPNGGTEALLDVLKAQKTRATFFVVGSQARRHPELVLRMVEDGHEVACHSETHRSLTDLSGEDLIRELFGPIATVHEITGTPPRLFRPPGGHFDSSGRKAAAAFGLGQIMWSAHCGPYEGGAVRTMEEYTASNVTAGSVVLMHNCEPTTLRALPGMISGLRARGLQPVTVSALRK